MESAVIAAIIGAGIGSLAAYWLGIGLARKKETESRRAISSAALADVYAITYSMDVLVRHWPGKKVKVELPTRVLDEFMKHITLFQQETVNAVFDFRGTVRDVLVGLDTLRTEAVADPGKMKKEIQMLAGVAIAKAVVARRQLEAEGGALPKARYWPGSNDVETHITEVKTYLTDTSSQGGSA